MTSDANRVLFKVRNWGLVHENSDVYFFLTLESHPAAPTFVRWDLPFNEIVQVARELLKTLEVIAVAHRTAEIMLRRKYEKK